MRLILSMWVNISVLLCILTLAPASVFGDGGIDMVTEPLLMGFLQCLSLTAFALTSSSCSAFTFSFGRGLWSSILERMYWLLVEAVFGGGDVTFAGIGHWRYCRRLRK